MFFFCISMYLSIYWLQSGEGGEQTGGKCFPKPELLLFRGGSSPPHQAKPLFNENGTTMSHFCMYQFQKPICAFFYSFVSLWPGWPLGCCALHRHWQFATQLSWTFIAILYFCVFVFALFAFVCTEVDIWGCTRASNLASMALTWSHNWRSRPKPNWTQLHLT